MFFQRKEWVCPLAYDDIPLSRPVEELSFIVFDTEATGFRVAGGDRLIEIGAVAVAGLEVVETQVFQSFADPQQEISREITELTSITGEMVQNAPPAPKAIRAFFDFIAVHDPACLIGHYVSFDALLLKQELKREKISLKGFRAIDTLNMIGYIAPSRDMRDLERYAQAFGTRIYERHRALGDALTTAYLFTELLRQFKARGCATWGDLLEAARDA